MGLDVSPILKLKYKGFLRQVQPAYDFCHNIINLNIMWNCDLCRVAYYPLSIPHLILEHLEILGIAALIHVVYLDQCVGWRRWGMLSVMEACFLSGDMSLCVQCAVLLFPLLFLLVLLRFQSLRMVRKQHNIHNLYHIILPCIKFVL